MDKQLLVRQIKTLKLCQRLLGFSNETNKALTFGFDVNFLLKGES